jgi:cell division protein FtsX
MPVFIAAIGGMLINLVGTLVGRVLIALGMSVITYTGMSASLDMLKSQAVSSFTALPPEVFSMLAAMKVGVSISIVTSAIAARMLLDGLQSDTFKRWALK